MTDEDSLPEGGCDAEAGEAAAFFNSIHSGLGDEFSRELHDTVRQTTHMPLAWVSVGPRTRRRLLIRLPYQVICATLPGTLLVLAVGHQHRRPDFWHERLSQINPAP